MPEARLQRTREAYMDPTVKAVLDHQREMARLWLRAFRDLSESDQKVTDWNVIEGDHEA